MLANVVMSLEKYLIIDKIADMNPPTMIPDNSNMVDDPFLNSLDTITVTKTVNKDHHTHVNNTRICVEGPVFDSEVVDI